MATTITQDCAADVIRQELRKLRAESGTFDTSNFHIRAAGALAAAGLLAPDLPEPDESEWKEGHSVISLDDEGFILLSIDPRPTHPGRATRIAHKILAAAAHTNKGREL